MTKPTTITIDEVQYTRADSVKKMAAPNTSGLKYCVVRTYSAGVHIGYVGGFQEKHPQSAVLFNSRRLHYWDGAASLSQVAMDGVNDSSRIAMEVPELHLTDVIEVIPCSEKAAEFFQKAKVWKK